jgi:mono/diheme cytochrome c family protein
VRQRLRRILGAFWIVAGILSFSVDGFAEPGSATNGDAQDFGVATQGKVYSIVLPHLEPELPLGPGRDDYLVVCVSCHSARYVMMQPYFPQRQWEETVDKMTKVYGAQMDQEQRASIVQYLVATHGPNSVQATSAGDDDADFVPVAKPSSRTEAAPLLHVAHYEEKDPSPQPSALGRGEGGSSTARPAAESAEHKKQVERGAELFKQDCAGCHGVTGRGDGFVAQVLLRQPKDLAANRFSAHLLSEVLWNGKRGTAMPSWRGLAPADLDAVAAYVLTLHPTVRPDKTSPEALERGNQVFQKNCAQCHGVLGDGKGPAAANLIPEPANFKLKQPDFEYVIRVVSEGIPGTGMPAWKEQIAESDRQALASFVRGLFEGAD